MRSLAARAAMAAARSLAVSSARAATSHGPRDVTPDSMRDEEAHPETGDDGQAEQDQDQLERRSKSPLAVFAVVSASARMSASQVLDVLLRASQVSFGAPKLRDVSLGDCPSRASWIVAVWSRYACQRSVICARVARSASLERA